MPLFTFFRKNAKCGGPVSQRFDIHRIRPFISTKMGLYEFKILAQEHIFVWSSVLELTSYVKQTKTLMNSKQIEIHERNTWQSKKME
jgi:hypothetical protein